MITTKTFKTIALTLAASASALTLVSAPSAFAMDQKLGGVVGCNASGHKQEIGAVVGGLLGAVAGSNLAKNDRGTGTAIGAVAGAGAGSYVGCKMQKKDARQAVGGTYKNDGTRFADSIQAAPVTRINDKFVARSNLNLRAAASTRGAKVGGIGAGQTFQALGRTGDGKWILVGQDGVGVGYVSSAYVYRA
jgi:hypothetical protein